MSNEIKNQPTTEEWHRVMFTKLSSIEENLELMRKCFEDTRQVLSRSYKQAGALLEVDKKQ